MTLARMQGDMGQLIRYNKKGLTRQRGSSPTKEMVILIFTKILYLSIFLILPLMVSEFSWWIVLLGFLIMHLVAGFIMSTVFQMAHLVENVAQPYVIENGIIHKEWAIHELETTANFSRKSKLFGWFIGGLNFQIEHHLFPNICHVHYRAISPIVEKTAQEYGIPYHENRTFFNAIASHMRMLYALGR